MSIKAIKQIQENFHEQENLEYRINALKKLKQVIQNHEQDIYRALNLDLNKSEKESFLSEYNEAITEIDNHLKHLKIWAKPKKVKSTYQVLKTKSYIFYKPKGRVLLIAPFNYPINLCFLPLIGAISAGNQVLIKMSSLTTNTAKVVNTIINEAFKKEHVYFLNESLKNYDDLFDYEPQMLFFTGSTNVGKKLEAKCVEKNIEYVTELGGQCPCVVFDSTNNAIYDRIIWAKFLNAGQTCVSINYLLYQEQNNTLIQALINSIKQQFPNCLINKSIPKLINQKAFDKMLDIINENKNNILYGGNYDKKNLIIEPTIIEVSQQDLNKYGEIFGPILLVCKLKNNFNDYINLINQVDNSALAAYLYTDNNNIKEQFLREINAGGYCINDSIAHITNHHLPFGGVYSSGSGQYHGKYSFQAFSFRKPLLINNAKNNVPIKFINNEYDLTKTKKMINLIKKFKPS